jgi:palmitoyl-protein thioesterase
MNGTVRNYLSIGGPNMGVSDIPGCFDGAICNTINDLAREFVYMGIVQSHLGPAGYFRDPSNMEGYLKTEFLPYLNNEAGDATVKAAIKQRFSALNGAMLVKFTEDVTVFPRESEWFQAVDPADMKTVIALKDSDFWKDDYIGLRYLDEQSKVQWIEIVGQHLQFSEDDIKNTFIPFLIQ